MARHQLSFISSAECQEHDPFVCFLSYKLKVYFLLFLSVFRCQVRIYGCNSPFNNAIARCISHRFLIPEVQVQSQDSSWAICDAFEAVVQEESRHNPATKKLFLFVNWCSVSAEFKRNNLTYKISYLQLHLLFPAYSFAAMHVIG
jgi:hypothetical protein